MLPLSPRLAKSLVLVLLANDPLLQLFQLAWLRPKLVAASPLLIPGALHKLHSLLLPSPHSVREKVKKLLLMLLRT